MSAIEKINDFQFGTHYHLEKYRLSNGLGLIIFPDTSAPIFAYHTWFHVGSRNEKKGITGIAHLFEHLMFKETTNFKEGQFDRMLEEAGGKLNAATYLDWTFYRQSLPIEAFDMICELEADRMQNVILSQAQLDAEREVVANERRMRVDNSPTGIMYENLYKLAFEKHTYHHPVIGWMEDIETISLENCMKFYKDYYAPNNATIVVVGDLKTDEVLEKINHYYGSIPASDLNKPALTDEPEQTFEKTHKIELELSSPRILLGYKIPQSTHQDIPKLELMQSVLFNGRSSRLYRKLVHQAQIATNASGWVNHTMSPGLYIIDVTLKEKVDPKQAMDLIETELQKLINEPISETEIQKCKTKNETAFWGQLTTNDDKAQSLGFHELVYGDYRLLFDEVHHMEKLTALDVQEVAKKYLTPSRRTTITALPKRKA